ncbi:MAG: hypothetical protein A2Y24_04820 [Clostridiales bacterium GWE2_32_10]|nr:MAG: hypothetical protein A2Y24_04820 [Clostridiales bacterium GWE2_32_10]HBY20305.1 hypothetical protein [Clostridiales bacterium]
MNTSTAITIVDNGVYFSESDPEGESTVITMEELDEAGIINQSFWRWDNQAYRKVREKDEDVL